MKIMFVIGSLSGGGAERVVSRLANFMADNGHDIYVSLIANDKREYLVSDKVSIKFIDTPIRIRGIRMLSRMINFRRYVKTVKPDVVISFTAAVNIFTLRALRYSDNKVIVSERNNPYTDPRDICSRKIRDRIYGVADGFVFQTPEAKQYFSEILGDVGVVIANPIAADLPIGKREIKEKKIITIGRLEEQKNQTMLINAFFNIKDSIQGYILEIYGEGKLKEQLQKQIDNLGLRNRVFLCGYDEDVLNKMRNATLFVLPSDYEGLSNALIEAMAMGVPVISTDHPIGGARMVIKNGINGILVPCKNQLEMEKAIISVINNPKLQDNLSKNACDIRDELEISNIVCKWLEYCEEVICKRSV